MHKPFILYIAILLNFAGGSCGHDSSATPGVYKYTVSVRPEEYAIVSNRLVSTFQVMLSKNITPFAPGTVYDSSTRVFVDSVIYSPDKLRMIALVISRVLLNKNKVGGDRKLEYNANYIFCDRLTLAGNIRVYEYAPFNLVNYHSYSEVKDALMQLCFFRRSSDKWTDNEFKFNMNDKRFWTSNEFSFVIQRKPFVSFD